MLVYPLCGSEFKLFKMHIPFDLFMSQIKKCFYINNMNFKAPENTCQQKLFLKYLLSSVHTWSGARMTRFVGQYGGWFPLPQAHEKPLRFFLCFGLLLIISSGKMGKKWNPHVLLFVLVFTNK